MHQLHWLLPVTSGCCAIPLFWKMEALCSLFIKATDGGKEVTVVRSATNVGDEVPAVVLKSIDYGLELMPLEYGSDNKLLRISGKGFVKEVGKIDSNPMSGKKSMALAYKLDVSQGLVSHTSKKWEIELKLLHQTAGLGMLKNLTDREEQLVANERLLELNLVAVSSNLGKLPHDKVGEAKYKEICSIFVQIDDPVRNRRLCGVIAHDVMLLDQAIHKEFRLDDLKDCIFHDRFNSASLSREANVSKLGAVLDQGLKKRWGDDTANPALGSLRHNPNIYRFPEPSACKKFSTTVPESFNALMLARKLDVLHKNNASWNRLRTTPGPAETTLSSTFLSRTKPRSWSSRKEWWSGSSSSWQIRCRRTSSTPRFYCISSRIRDTTSEAAESHAEPGVLGLNNAKQVFVNFGVANRKVSGLSTLEKFTSSVPMPLNFVAMPPHGYFAHLNLLCYIPEKLPTSQEEPLLFHKDRVLKLQETSGRMLQKRNTGFNVWQHLHIYADDLVMGVGEKESIWLMVANHGHGNAEAPLPSNKMDVTQRSGVHEMEKSKWKEPNVRRHHFWFLLPVQSSFAFAFFAMLGLWLVRGYGSRFINYRFTKAAILKFESPMNSARLLVWFLAVQAAVSPAVGRPSPPLTPGSSPETGSSLGMGMPAPPNTKDMVMAEANQEFRHTDLSFSFPPFPHR